MERTYPLLEMLQKAIYENQLPVSEEQFRLLRNYKKCRTEDLGRQEYHCDHCDTTVFSYNACNTRGCPKCYQKNQIAWFHKAYDRILLVEHHHLVFSIPGCYTLDWLKDKKDFINDMFRCTSYVIKKLEKARGLRLGYVSVFQSHAKGLSYKPHIHCALTNGGLDETGIWKPMDPLPLQVMTQQFEKRFRKIRKVDPSTKVKGKWNIYCRTHEKTPKSILGYLAQSINCVSPEIDAIVDTKGNSFVTLLERKCGNLIKTQLSEMDYLERYLNHIPPQRSVIVRYYGLYSNRYREELATARAQVEKEERMDLKSYLPKCPNCKNEMRLVSIEWNVHNRITEKYRPPPPDLQIQRIV